MQNSFGQKEFDIICVIINFGFGSKVLKYAKENGIFGGTILLGKGTVKNRILELLELSEIRKEIVLMIAEQTLADKFLEKLSKKFKLDKPNHGIAFSSSVIDVLGTKMCKCSGKRKNGGGDITMYNAIYVVVDKGRADEVVKSAKKAGARGGTVINARGSGIHETGKLFSMDIEPEKDFILILADTEITDAVTTNIRNDLKIDEPGNGIIYVQSVNKTYGIY